MASITEISVEHIPQCHESIRGNIAIGNLLYGSDGIHGCHAIHRLYAYARRCSPTRTVRPTMKDLREPGGGMYFCIAAVALFPRAAGNLEQCWAKLMDDLQAGFGGKVYDVADLFPKPIIAQIRETVQRHVGMDVAGVVAQLVGSSFDYLLAYVAGVSRPFTCTRRPCSVGRYMFLLLLELISPVAISLFLQRVPGRISIRERKNLLVCYLMVPAFILASQFSDISSAEYVREHLVECRPAVLFSLRWNCPCWRIVSRIRNLFKTTEEWKWI